MTADSASSPYFIMDFLERSSTDYNGRLIPLRRGVKSKIKEKNEIKFCLPLINLIRLWSYDVRYKFGMIGFGQFY